MYFSSGLDIRIIAAMPNPPEIQHAGSKAFYSPITDRITLPPRELFASGEEYYATALHETVHYADFGIMPSFLWRAFDACIAKATCRHNRSVLG